MTTMTITRPAPAGRYTLSELRVAVAAARRARRQRHEAAAAYWLRKKKNADLAADITGLPLCFVLQVAARLDLAAGERDDVAGLVAPAVSP
jgi:hypothetical protein